MKNTLTRRGGKRWERERPVLLFLLIFALHCIFLPNILVLSFSWHNIILTLAFTLCDIFPGIFALTFALQHILF